MKDIALSGDGKGLALENGDLKLIDGKDRVIQQIYVGLRILKGDWYLDYRAGIDYINGLKAYPKIMKSEIKKAILEVMDVDNVQNYFFMKKGDAYNVRANVSVNNQVYNIDEVVRL